MAAWPQELCSLGGGDQCGDSGGSRAGLRCWAGPRGGKKWSGARNRRTNIRIHQFDLEFVGLGKNTGSALQVFDRMLQWNFNSNF